MTIGISSKTLSDYDAHLAYNTATAFLRKSDLANYLIDQLEQQHVKRYTALGFGTDQGKLGNVNGLAIAARSLNVHGMAGTALHLKRCARVFTVLDEAFDFVQFRVK